MNDTANPTVDTSSLLRCYALLALGMPLTFVPLGPLSGVAMLFMIIGIIWAYILRRRLAGGELFYNHTTWMIRTFWISSLFFLIAIIVSGTIVSANADSSAIDRVSENLENGTLLPHQIRAVMAEYRETNKTLLLGSTLACFTAPIIYAVLRFVKGYRLADAGKQVENLKSWGI